MVKVDFKDSADELKMDIYDYISSDGEGFSADDVKETLEKAKGKSLNIHINSYGGEVFEGFAIYNLLRDYTGHKTVTIDGIAASIASVIAMCGDKVIMSDASMMMIHNASGVAVGTFKEMEQVAEALKKINSVIRDVYKTKTGLSDEVLTELMDNESYLKAQECLDYGFVDEVIDSKKEKESEEETEEEEKEKEKKDVSYNLLIKEFDMRIQTLNSLKKFEVEQVSIPSLKETVEQPKNANKLKQFFNVKEKK